MDFQREYHALLNTTQHNASSNQAKQQETDGRKRVWSFLSLIMSKARPKLLQCRQAGEVNAPSLPLFVVCGQVKQRNTTWSRQAGSSWFDHIILQ